MNITKESDFKDGDFAAKNLVFLNHGVSVVFCRLLPGWFFVALQVGR